jgi:hypothetical protein
MVLFPAMLVPPEIAEEGAATVTVLLHVLVHPNLIRSTEKVPAASTVMQLVVSPVLHK